MGINRFLKQQQQQPWRLLSFLLLLLVFLQIIIIPTAKAAVVVVEQEQEECTMGPDGTCETKTTTLAAAVTEEEGTVIETGFGEGQKVAGPHGPATRDKINEIIQYMKDQVFKGENVTDPTKKRILQSVASECKMRHELCAFWAVIGECTSNPGYMTIQCAPACMSCEQLAFETRCPMPTELNNTWAPGGLNAMFDRIVSSKPSDLMLDRPVPENNGTNTATSDNNDTNATTTATNYSTLNREQKPYNITVLLRPTKQRDAKSGTDVWQETKPWVVMVDDFLTELECQTMIDLGATQGYQQSKDVGAKKFDGTYDANVSPGRTSTNAWCQDACMDSPITQHVIAKIETLTGIPDANAEYLQLLKYEVGQFYERHHDYIEFHTERAQGVRILTVFLYLNDVEEGGGTDFPALGVTVQAKRGRALLWASVHDQRPDDKDPRTDHQALPVIKGIKYGANAWLHQRDFKAPFAVNCI